MGCWVNTKLWASLISFPHTAISLNSARPLMAWEVALAITKRMSWASCSYLQHIHHMARASWEGGGSIHCPWYNKHAAGSAVALFLLMCERQVDQQHTTRRAHEWSFSPPPVGYSAFTGRVHLLLLDPSICCLRTTFPSVGI